MSKLFIIHLNIYIYTKLDVTKEKPYQTFHLAYKLYLVENEGCWSTEVLFNKNTSPEKSFLFYNIIVVAEWNYLLNEITHLLSLLSKFSLQKKKKQKQGKTKPSAMRLQDHRLKTLYLLFPCFKNILKNNLD